MEDKKVASVKKVASEGWFSELLSSVVKCCEAPQKSMEAAHGRNDTIISSRGASIEARANQQCGIGVVVTVVGDDLVVDEIAPGGPAAKSGELKLGDIIVQVDGREVVGGQPDAELLSLILGLPGTIVDLTVLRGTSRMPHKIKMMRGFVRPVSDS